MGLRASTAIISAAIGVFLIVLLSLVLPDSLAQIMLDVDRETWPFTVQNIMWIVFAVGLGELFMRYRAAREEERQISQSYLPEDDASLLRPGEELNEIYQTVTATQTYDVSFLPRLISRCVLTFNMTGSADQTNSVLNSSIELFLHEIDLRYNMVRYISWLVPSLGFIGTVLGIMLALQYAGDRSSIESPEMLYNVTARLGVAFSTTLVALIMAAVLVLIQNIVQAREERALNRSSQYCLDNLINRLYP